MQALGLKGKVKIADDWLETPYIILEVTIDDIPVYRVHQETG